MRHIISRIWQLQLSCQMEASILSTRKIVPVAGMDTTLLVVVVEVTIGALWMKLKLPYWYIGSLSCFLPFSY